jgi:hypothetical protein
VYSISFSLLSISQQGLAIIFFWCACDWVHRQYSPGQKELDKEGKQAGEINLQKLASRKNAPGDGAKAEHELEQGPEFESHFVGRWNFANFLNPNFYVNFFPFFLKTNIDAEWTSTTVATNS